MTAQQRARGLPTFRELLSPKLHDQNKRSQEGCNCATAYYLAGSEAWVSGLTIDNYSKIAGWTDVHYCHKEL
jgi:hypothetical protein